VTKNGQDTTKVKLYKYSEKLTILNNYFQKRKTKGNIETEVEVDDHEETQYPMERENENSQSQKQIIYSQSQVIKTVKAITIFHRDKHHKHRQREEGFKPQETAASTLMKYIINNKSETTTTPLTPIDPVDAFWADIAPT
jgi:hypothetical protein